MRCGEKCFIAEIKVKDERKIKKVLARTPAEARKTLRSTLGKETEIIFVKQEKRK